MLVRMLVNIGPQMLRCGDCCDLPPGKALSLIAGGCAEAIGEDPKEDPKEEPENG